jgi:hypothetical protein
VFVFTNLSPSETATPSNAPLTRTPKHMRQAGVTGKRFSAAGGPTAAEGLADSARAGGEELRQVPFPAQNPPVPAVPAGM